MKAISNSTPLIYLAKINHLDLLEKVYDQIYIPTSVYEETVVRGLEKKFLDAGIIKNAVEKGTIEVKELTSEQKAEAERLTQFANIGGGEAEAIVLAKHLNLELIIDDVVAQGVARTLGLDTHWTTSFIIRLVSKKLLSRKEARKMIEDLVSSGYRISEEVLIEILKVLS
ncbi:MAG: DUF3368 domain-containing protein [Methanosarcinales archaeon]|nr:MAG: DUF3368 domain-containing protein [Methanosarcinales archaeon]